MRRTLFVLATLVIGATPSAVAAAVRSATVAVPRVLGLDLNRAYERLHDAGVRVSDTRSFPATSAGCLPVVSRETPSVGSRASRGSAVELRLEAPLCGVGSPGVPDGPLPAARVPKFVGRSLSVAVAWADKHQLYWDAGRLPRLHNANATTLFANYRTLSQTPLPGRTLRLGIGTGSGNSGTFRPTPLTLHCASR